LNYLQLAQRLRQEAGISGTGPSSVLSQTGEMKRVVDWIAAAWDDIQIDRQEWYWMRATFSFTTTLGDGSYSSSDAGISTRFSHWKADSLHIYLQSSGVGSERCLEPVDYDAWRETYLVGTQSNGFPRHVAIDPALNLRLGDAPDGVYVVSGEYFKTPQTLANDEAIPEMPTQYHMAIVYRALMLYARYEAAGEIYDDAQRNYRRIMRRVELNQLPPITLADPLL
jgi:hypothetical protein